MPSTFRTTGSAGLPMVQSSMVVSAGAEGSGQVVSQPVNFRFWGDTVQLVKIATETKQVI